MASLSPMSLAQTRYAVVLRALLSHLAPQVRARLINGARVKIDALGDDGPSVTVGAMYSSGAQITSAGNVRVTSCHGRIAVNTAGSPGGVNLGSVNGTAQVSTGARVNSVSAHCVSAA